MFNIWIIAPKSLYFNQKKRNYVVSFFEFSYINKAIPVIINNILNHCDVDKLNKNPRALSPLKNSRVNLTILYNIQYIPAVL